MPKLVKPTVGQLHKKLQPIFNHYIRLRDKGEACISCDKPWDETHQAGHFIPASHYATRYDEDNVHGQCMQCNGFRRGNWPGYLRGLLDRYGDSFVWRLGMEWGSVRKYTVAELQGMIERYTALIEELSQ